MFPQTKSVFKAAQVLGITRKQLPVEFKGFRVCVIFLKQYADIYTANWTSFQSLFLEKKLFFLNLKKVMKNSHAANKHKNTQNIHKSQKQFHISRPETFLIRNKDSTP